MTCSSTPRSFRGRGSAAAARPRSRPASAPARWPSRPECARSRSGGAVLIGQPAPERPSPVEYVTHRRRCHPGDCRAQRRGLAGQRGFGAPGVQQLGLSRGGRRTGFSSATNQATTSPIDDGELQRGHAPRSRRSLSADRLAGISLRASRSATSGTSSLPDAVAFEVDGDGQAGSGVGEGFDGDVDVGSDGSVDAAHRPALRCPPPAPGVPGCQPAPDAAYAAGRDWLPGGRDHGHHRPAQQQVGIGLTVSQRRPHDPTHDHRHRSLGSAR